jgi:hypothetical protein
MWTIRYKAKRRSNVGHDLMRVEYRISENWRLRVEGKSMLLYEIPKHEIAIEPPSHRLKGKYVVQDQRIRRFVMQGNCEETISKSRNSRNNPGH